MTTTPTPVERAADEFAAREAAGALTPQARGSRRRWNTMDSVLAKVDRRNGACWTWRGTFSRSADGSRYATVRMAGRTWRVHRLLYEQFVGTIPDGLYLDHRCRNTRCVNPAHMEPVTPGENTRRGLKGFALTGLCRAGLHGPEDWGDHPDGGHICLACARTRRTEKHALINQARAALGLKHDEYRRRYGSSAAAARSILTQTGATR